MNSLAFDIEPLPSVVGREPFAGDHLAEAKGRHLPRPLCLTSRRRQIRFLLTYYVKINGCHTTISYIRAAKQARLIGSVRSRASGVRSGCQLGRQRRSQALLGERATEAAGRRLVRRAVIETEAADAKEGRPIRQSLLEAGTSGSAAAQETTPAIEPRADPLVREVERAGASSAPGRSALRSAPAGDQSGARAVSRRYMSLGSLAVLSDAPRVSLPDVAA